MMNSVNGQSHRIERAVMESLTSSDHERFAMVAERIGAIKVALQASLQTGDAVHEVRRLLQLIVAFETKLASPAVAEALRSVVQADPDAQALIRRHWPEGPMSEVRRYAEDQGRHQPEPLFKREVLGHPDRLHEAFMALDPVDQEDIETLDLPPVPTPADVPAAMMASAGPETPDASEPDAWAADPQPWPSSWHPGAPLV